MLMRVGYDVYNRATNTTARLFVDVEAVSGDDAVEAATARLVGVEASVGIKIIEVSPAPADAVSVDDAEPVKRGPGRPRKTED